MSNERYNIVPYDAAYQQGVDAMMASIAAEFEETIYPPDAQKLNELAKIPGRSYWLALHDDRVVGTVGIAMIPDNIAVLKGMMVHKDHRGAGKQLSTRMLETAEQAARSQGATIICLGTMLQMKGAQRFYEKHGYILITEDQLPDGFPGNPVDKVFYRKDL